MRLTEEIRNFSESELNQIIEAYPWFTLARREYYDRLVSKGIDRKSAARNVAIFMLDRSFLLKDRHQHPVVEDVSKPVVREKVKVVYAGGDYFSHEEVVAMEQSSDGFGKIEFRPNTASHKECIPESGFMMADGEKINYEDTVYTETLAEIYKNQGIDSRAMEVYRKLILIYPEKSAYFASLIDEIKTKNN